MNYLKELDSQNFDYLETPFTRSFYTVREVADFLKIEEGQIGKTMLVQIGGNDLFLFLISGDRKLDMERLRRLFPNVKVNLVHHSKIEQLIGVPAGAVTPLIGLNNVNIQIVFDTSIFRFEKINISSGELNLGVEVSVDGLFNILKAKNYSVSMD